MEPQKFQKKPVVIEAMQYTDNASATEIINWALSENGITITYHCDNDEQCRLDDHTLRIPTLEGTMYASLGYWIIKGINGEFYPCKPDIFEKSYEAV